MGGLLATPVKQWRGSDSGDGRQRGGQPAYGAACVQGWRSSMEDAYAAQLDCDSRATALFAVFDGHRGGEVSRYLARHLPAALAAAVQAAYSCEDAAARICSAFLAMDARLASSAEARQELRAIKLRCWQDSRSWLQRIVSAASAAGLLAADDAAAVAGAMRHAAAAPAGDAAAHSDAAVAVAGVDGSAVAADGKDDCSPLMRVLLRAVKRAAVDDDIPDGAAVTAAAAQAAFTLSSRAAKKLMRRLRAKLSMDSVAGSTAVVTLLRRDGCCIVANLGDSRAVLCRRGRAVALSTDHVPDSAAEHARIMRAGGTVRGGRINGQLNLSRCFGDFAFKARADLAAEEQCVSALPDVHAFWLDEGDEFIVLASDGVWEVKSSDDVISFVSRRLRAGLPLRRIAQQLCDACMAPARGGHDGEGTGLDNLTAIIVDVRAVRRSGRKRGREDESVAEEEEEEGKEEHKAAHEDGDRLVHAEGIEELEDESKRDGDDDDDDDDDDDRRDVRQPPVKRARLHESAMDSRGGRRRRS